MNLPFFSIIIPTRDRPDRLVRCLEALTLLEYPRDRFEVIIIDDGSKQPCKAVVAPFHQKLTLALFCQQNTGPAAARNKGAAHARGEFLAFTDDDCIPAPDWLYRLAVRFRQTPDHAIGGQTINALIKNPYAATSQLLISYLYAYFNSGSKGPKFFTSNNLAMPASLFRAVGGFDNSFPRAAAEDREFCDRWSYRGYQLSYASEVQVYHMHSLTLRSFWRQHFNYGRGAFHFHQTRARRTQKRIELEPNAFYRNLLLYPRSQVSGRRRALFTAALLLKAQIANAVGFGWEWLSRAKRKAAKSDKRGTALLKASPSADTQPLD